MQRSIIEIPVVDSTGEVGFEMMMMFNMSIFGAELAQIYTADPQKLFNKMKERLTTKYPESVFEKTEFILNVKKGVHIITQSSRTQKWKTLEQKLRDLTISSPASCRILFDEELIWKSIKARVTEYHLSRDNLELKHEFPTFGERCIPGQRVHIYVQNRLIESRSKPIMDKRDGHNTQNGEIVFIHAFSADSGSFADLPTPSTTKVSIKDDCPNLPGIYQTYLGRKKQIEDQKKAEQKQREKEAREKRKAQEAARAIEAASKAAASIAAARAAAGGGNNPSNNPSNNSSNNPKILRSLLPKTKQVSSSTSPNPSQEENEPTSPSMPYLELIVTPSFPTTSAHPAHPVIPALPKTSTSFTQQDMMEMMQMSLALMTPENAAIFKSQVVEKFGI